MPGRDRAERLLALPAPSVWTVASTTTGGRPQLRPRRNPHPVLLPRHQRPRRRIPGTLLRRRVAGCVWHSDRGGVPFDEEGARPGTACPGSGAQDFDAVTDISTCERVLRAVHWVAARVCV